MTTAGLDRLVLDHLWQSTLFTLGVGLLVRLCRRGPAGVRYGLWFAASAKFLVPFAALAALGRLTLGRLALARLIATPGPAPARAALLERATRPLSQFPLTQALPAFPSTGPLAASAGHAAPHVDLSLILLAIWALGCAVVLARWLTRTAKVLAAVRSASPLAWTAPAPVVASPSLLEPGLVGLWRPVLVVPATLPERLTQPAIDALVAHEACHLRRRDNLTAAIHMLAEALVWFHPLVWWIGARLIEERERACDEAVVRAGHDRAAYAGSLVAICRFYLQSPLLCVAGASGSNLARRVETIMTAPVASPLSRAKKALLVAAGALALATPVAAGVLTSPAGRQVAAPLARVVAAMSSPAQALEAGSAALASAPAPDEGKAVRPVALAGDDIALAPGGGATATDVIATTSAQDIAPPPAPEALPIQLASADAAPATPRPAQAAEPADPRQQAYDFVRSYAEVGLLDWVMHLDQRVCLQVEGLPPDQAGAVKARIEAVAQTLSLKLFSVHELCGGEKNVRVVFTADPQHALDDMIADHPQLVGDAHSDTRGVKTVTRPIQAWYRTICVWTACASDPVAFAPDTVTVLVDAKRTSGMKLGTIADYVAMVALSEPRSPDRCQVLPSVIDLFAGPCSGRSAPTGLTPNDLAYLKAVYTAGRRLSEPVWSWAEGGGSVDQVAGRMGMLLAGSGVLPSPGPAPEKR